MWEPGAGEIRICPPYAHARCKRRLKWGGVSRNRCLDGHVKEPYEMSMAWELDRGSNFFLHLCTVTCITEIALIPIHTHTQPQITSVPNFSRTTCYTSLSWSKPIYFVKINVRMIWDIVFRFRDNLAN